MSRLSEPTHAPAAPCAAPQQDWLARLWPLTPRLALVLVAASALVGGGVGWLTLRFGASSGLAPLAVLLAAAAASALPALLLLKASRELECARTVALAAGTLDPVTGISGREPFLSLAEREFARSRRYGIGAALLLVDVDRFRRLIDDRERAAGELVLREVAASIQVTLRGADALARFGPAQIAVFVAHADALGALDVAERIRERVEQLEIACRDQRLRATVSVGVVLMRPAHLSLQAVIEDAEAALGAARQAGGNCVRAAPVDRRRLPQGWRGPSVGDNQAAGS
ncbi:MAG TPA: GGDEF domain-containing protein [Rubrivivax sp.]|nr:GGDEF domain-containing protein [Burkholderiales bacterium]HNT37837.1 GGDEF domain-containing protein [Rubrivivax sp.]